MWIATNDGLVKYDNNFKVVFKPDHATFKRIFQVTVDRDNNKYFIYNRQLFKIPSNQDTVLKCTLNIPSRSPVTVISIDRLNNFWVVTASAEAFKISNGQVQRLKVPVFPGPFHGTSPLNFFSIKHSGANLTSFNSSKGVFVVQHDSLSHIGYKYPAIPDRSNTMTVLRTSLASMWVGSDSGVFKISPGGTSVQLTKTNGFTNNTVTCLFEDAERNLWFGTYGDGVFKLSTEAVSVYDQFGDVDLSNIEALGKTDGGDIVFGSYSQGIVRMRGQTFTKNPFSNKPTFFRYVTGLAAKGDLTFIGTFGQGMFEYNNNSSTMKRANLNVQEHFVNAVLPYKQGFIVFAGGRFAYSFDNDHRLLARKEMQNLTSLFAITDSTLMLIQNGIIDIYDANLNLLQKGLFTEIHSRLSCLEFYNNYILAGTIGEGLFLYDRNYRYIGKLFSRSNIIYSLKVSGNHLFIGSNVGLSKLPVAGFPNIRNAEEKVIFNGECKEEGILAYNDDTILVTSSKGLFIINTKEEDFNFTKPVLTLQSLQFKNHEGRLASDMTDIIHTGGRNKILKIPYNKNELQVSLKGVSQSSPELLNFQFILENYEHKWNNANNADMIRYTNLPAGGYVFKARLNSKGSVSQILTIPFTIDKPLQAKWWFQLLVFALFVVFAIFLLKVFNKLNQRYIQTKWINRSANELQTKKSLIGQLVKNTKIDLQVFKEYLAPRQKSSEESERYLEFYFKTTLSRLDLLWEKDFLNLRQLDDILRSFAQNSFDTTVEISHDLTHESVLIPSDKADKIVRLFSLFIFYSVETNQARQFAVTSKIRLGNQLFLKIYSTETVANATKNSIHRHLENSIRELNRNNFSVEFIESENLGNMIILNLNLETSHAIGKEFQRSGEA
jgi:hypothetical protein